MGRPARPVHDRVVRSGVTEQQFTDFVKSTYRVLLTRGLRGCYVYFMDAPTRDFFLSRTEPRARGQSRTAEPSAQYVAAADRAWGCNRSIWPATRTPIQPIAYGRVASSRLFLSHTSTHKEVVGALKARLGVLGVAAFVAHEDIEPTLEWQHEIVLALETVTACGLITDDFHASKWTDHEVGFAIGRNAFVFSVRLPLHHTASWDDTKDYLAT